MHQLDEITISLISLAIREDLGSGDLTSNAIFSEKEQLSAYILSRQKMVVCGQSVAKEVFGQIDPHCYYFSTIEDGIEVPAETEIARISGSARAILAGERTALNFLQRLSGIATKVHKLNQLVLGTNAKIFDTRKTLPGWRSLDKYAVAVGGGGNHRMGLFDAVLLKNNHVDAIGGDIARAIETCRSSAPAGTHVQVEVRNFSELERALSAKPDGILLDNMKPTDIITAVGIIRDSDIGASLPIEVSGGINEENLRSYALTGVDRISIGALTHSVQAADISLRYSSFLKS